MATEFQMALADNAINKFRSRSGTPAFKHIHRTRLAFQLLARIHNAALINQSKTSLCGPAAFMFSVASKWPDKYARYVISLYEKGEAKIGGLKVKPGTDLKNYNLPAGYITEADWVALASLRDSDNDWYDYQAVDDKVAAITMPSSMQDWFTKAGFTNIQNDTNILIDKGLKDLLKAHSLHRSNPYTCLFIGASVIQSAKDKKKGRKNKDGSGTPDHWVVLTSDIKIGGASAGALHAKRDTIDVDDYDSKNVDFTVYSWGQRKRAVKRGSAAVTVDTFLDYFYGYVSAR